MTDTVLHLCNAAEIVMSDDGALPTEIELIPTGEFRLVDAAGRERPKAHTIKDGDALVKRSMDSAPSGVLPIDFEHGLDGEGTKGGSAAGWITGMRANGSRIMADVEWTPLGAEALRGKTYRFISPTFFAHAETGEVWRVARAGLTNIPALSMLKQLAASDAGAENVGLSQALAVALDLEQDASSEDIVAALMSRLTAQPAMTPATASAGPEAIPIEAVATYIKDQDARTRSTVVNMKVTAAMQAGRLPPSLETWATNLAETDMDAFERFMASTTLNVIGEIVPGGEPPVRSSDHTEGSPAAQIERQLGLADGTLSSDA